MAVLYVGDSLFKYVRINRSGSDVRFSSGARIEHLSAAMSDIKEYQGVVLHAGTNNLPYETSEKVIRRFQDLIGNIRMENQEIQVYVSSILPRDISFFPGAKNNLKFLDRCNQRAKEVYFQQNIKPEILKHSGRWILEEHDIYNPYSGVTTNISEGFNNIIKWVNSHKKLPVDNMVLSLFYLQNSAYAEVLRGRAGLGNFSLKDEYQFAALDPEYLIFPHKVIEPDDILKTVKCQIDSLSIPKSVPAEDILEDLGDYSRSKEEDTIFPDTFKVSVSCVSEQQKIEESARKPFESQEDLAERVVKSNGVKFVPDLKAYMVQGIRGKNYSVTLHPKEECHCPSTATCYHILAAKLYIGMSVKTEKEEKKLISLMRYKSRPRSQKKIGQKKPKNTDFEVIPAPDSKKAMENILENSPALDIPPTETTDKSTSCVKSKLKFSEQKLSTPVNSSMNSGVKDSVKAIPDSVKRSKGRRRSIKRLYFSSPGNKKRVRLYIPDKPTLDIREELIELEHYEPPEATFVEEPWLPELDLTLKDKGIITDNEWLSDKHMYAVNKILSRQFPHINGLQDTKTTPFFMDDQQFWNTDRQFKRQVSPSVQLHFDGVNHWAMSFSSSKDAHFIYYIDSLGANLKDLRNNVKIQLSQIYTTSSTALQVKVPRVQQQPNSYDCGLFAIANAVEFCFNPDCFNTRVTYTVSQMREHLIQCLESGNMTPFPKETVRGRCKLDSVTCKVVEIPIWCSCRMPECIDDMICCDNRKCRTWFHRKCLNLYSEANEWECPSCQQSN